MTVVVDASMVVAALVDSGPAGTWAATLLAAEPLVAPQHMPVEVAATLRRAVLAGKISQDLASIAHADLLSLPAALVAYEAVARRAWELRTNVTPYDAWYVALAEALDVGLATLDLRLAAAPGPRCAFVLPPL
ncbi:MAG: type II toxin-antitoxin system VapC family toxin [Dehalococcoidia bacterium]